MFLNASLLSYRIGWAFELGPFRLNLLRNGSYIFVVNDSLSTVSINANLWALACDVCS
jgi:hypothetical protein